MIFLTYISFTYFSYSLIKQVSWWSGNSQVPNSKYRKEEHENGTGSTESEINVLLRRSHLGNSFTCRVNR